MRRALRTTTVLIGLAGAAVLAVAGPARADHVETLTHLDLPAGSVWGAPVAGNAGGVLVGTVGDGGGDAGLRAARWTGHGVAILDTPPGAWSRANSVNRDGTTVGFVAPATSPDLVSPARHAQATVWNAAGVATPIAPRFAGFSVATSINDAGEIVGFASPPGESGTAQLIYVRFEAGAVIPLAPHPTDLCSDGTDLEHALGTSTRAGLTSPALSNTPTGNIVVGTVLTGSFVYGIDTGSFLQPGEFRGLPNLAGAPAGTITAGLAISADHMTILGMQFDSGERSLLWREIYRSGHPSYKPYTLPAPAGQSSAWAATMSPDADLIVDFGFTNNGTATVERLSTAATVIVENAIVYGITNPGLAYGTDRQGRPTTWQIH
ncbi:MAG: hypothetical protein QOH97_5574 [Actinoplanes sp.]|nr:hypothetical protein [Actinoplanes sp.]